jgi:hypothetical protein
VTDVTGNWVTPVWADHVRSSVNYVCVMWEAAVAVAELRDLVARLDLRLVPMPCGNTHFPDLSANVIESVFSGMARAVIHNSDYATVADTQAAITRYLDDRNHSFAIAPRRAGRFSVTQQFNTTTSMGRLTLNVLPSFAQFVASKRRAPVATG